MDIKFPRKLVFGTWPISGDLKKINYLQAKKIIKFAISNGFEEFDTAPNYGYGNSEKILGSILLKLKKKPLINTKIGNDHNKNKNFDVANLEKTFFKSVKLLNIKKINILFLHNPRNIKNLDKILLFLKKLKKNRLISNFGLSISKDFKYKKNFIKKFKIIQLDHNLIYIKNKFDNKFKSKFIYARSPLASGSLAFKINKKKIKKSDERSKWFKDKRKNIIKKQIHFLEKHYKNTVYKLAIDYVIKEKFCNKVIFGFSSITQIKAFLKVIKTLKKENVWNNYNQLYLRSNILSLKGF